MIPLNWDEGLQVLKPLGLFALGVAAYTIFIFKVYVFMAKRDILKANLAQYNRASHPTLQKTFAGALYVLEYLLILPICILFWSVVFTVLLALFSKTYDLDRILLISMAIVAAVRVAAYYNEEIAKDLAKTLPLSLLAVFIVDMNYVHLDESIALLRETPIFYTTLAYYFIGVVALEIVLRILSELFSAD